MIKMATDRFTVKHIIFDGYCIVDNTTEGYYAYDKQDLQNLCKTLNELNDENEELKNRLKDWHQRTFKAHEYFNILEKVIDEVCVERI